MRDDQGPCRDTRHVGAILEHIPVALYATDSEGWVTFYNEAAADFAGRQPNLGSDRWCVTWRLRRPDGSPLAHEECPMAITIRERRPIRGVEAVAERPDGSLVPFAPIPSPIFDQHGLLVGAVNVLVNITEQKNAEEREKSLRDELSRVTDLGLKATGVSPLLARAHAAVRRSRKLLVETAPLFNAGRNL